jgi:RNA polymerase sigma factor (TIGR02999 family)
MLLVESLRCPPVVTERAVETLFAAAASGDSEARQQIFAAVYGELRRLAQRELRRQGPGVGISPTELLHEAYLGFGARTGITFPDRARFMAYASRAMRGLILDFARERMAQKRGAGVEFTSFRTGVPEAAVDDLELTAIGDALEELAQHDAQLAEIVDLRFFCGLTFGEIAALRGVSERTVQRDWEKARLLLYRSIRTEQPR